MEAESDIFLTQPTHISAEAENVAFYDYAYKNYVSIMPAFDNIKDEIDIRDTSSLLATEYRVPSILNKQTDISTEEKYVALSWNHVIC
ncbi:hypothetical protein KM043_013438 [Ampulex compressa]|nr:hypothetical protein KM043_013438 [Ampulex compressa]